MVFSIYFGHISYTLIIHIQLIQHNTEALCLTYFTEIYNKFDAERDSLHDVGLTNEAVEELEGGLQVVQNEITKLHALFIAQQEKNQSLKALLAETAQTAATDDTSTIVSQLMSAMSTQHAVDMTQMKQQNKAFCQQLL